MTLSPSSANGLLACTAEQIDLRSTAPGECPLASQVGKVTIVSQLLEKPLEGRVYVGQPACSPCDGAQVEDGELVKMYIEVEGAGVRVKLPGSASVNQSTGVAHDDVPQQPPAAVRNADPEAEDRPPGAAGERPGVHHRTAGLGHADAVERGRHHARRGSGRRDPHAVAVHRRRPVRDQSPARRACPSNPASAPAANPRAPASTRTSTSRSPARTANRASRASPSTPPRACSARSRASPAVKARRPNRAREPCPAGSQIGTATSAVGPGSEPYVDSEGKVYLTGPYGEGPFGLKVEVPAKAGPFNLGTVVVRSAITIDQRSGAITVTSDPLPQSIDGIPLRLKAVKVDINRPEFMFNPTNCETQSVSAGLSGSPAAPAEASGGDPAQRALHGQLVRRRSASRPSSRRTPKPTGPKTAAPAST